MSEREAKRSDGVGRDEAGPAPGTKVAGCFTVKRLIGRGGMGVVVLAHDDVLDRDVAIKFVRRDLLDEPEHRARFLSEARAMARVRHPNVLPIYAFGEYEDTPYFVTEHVDGSTVDTWLRSRAPDTFPDLGLALRILDDTCRGVSAIHSANTVHRDLKPSNLLLDADFRVRVADMGVADLLHREDGSPRELVGTPEYMAPENVTHADVPPELAHRADVYSLGCLAYELLTGTTPFKKRGTMAAMVARLLEDVPPPSSLRPGLSETFDSIVLRALAKDPTLRTPSAEELRRELAAARDRGTRDPVRILLADDDDDFRELLASTLAREFPDATIESVCRGGAALAAFDQRSHSVAIVDLQMPDLDGMELTRLLRERDAARTVPIIVITASGGPTEWKRLAALGADGFLVKPVNVKDVVTLVRRALEERTSLAPRPQSVAPVETSSSEEQETLVEGPAAARAS